MLDGAPSDAVPALIAHHLTPVLNSAWPRSRPGAPRPRRARRSLDAVVHIDTGMNRLGLPGEELSVLAAEWKTRLKPVSIWCW